MDTGFQLHADFLALCDRLGSGINTTLFRHLPLSHLGKFPHSRTARLFCGKMFGVLHENLGIGARGFQTPTAPADESECGVNNL
jgi:hypothetical protein